MGIAGIYYAVDTSPTKKVIVDSLTRDISVEACLLDLIDNAIDSARSSLLEHQSRRKSNDDNILPKSYTGYNIKLVLSSKGCTIHDNCGGIAKEELEQSVLRFGLRSKKNSGIGVFGVGMNRALFKLGKKSRIKTDTGLTRSELILVNQKYLESESWELNAKELKTKGKPGTEIEILQPPEDIGRYFSDQRKVSDLRDELGRRYGRFISKGLIIELNGIKVSNNEIMIRRNGPYEIGYKHFPTKDGVDISIEFGQHNAHRFSAEPDYNEAKNHKLTKTYGWSILCNDRTVLVSDQTEKTGWSTKFHSEYYGFTGTVMFVCKDPSKLPWTTTKTDIDTNNRAYKSALEEMQSFAKQWREYALHAKLTKRRNEMLLPTPLPIHDSSHASTLDSQGTTPELNKTKRSGPPKPTVKPDHNQFRTVLPTDVDETFCKDKLLTLVHEAKKLDLSDLNYSGLALIRCLFEVSSWHYLVRHKKFDELKSHAINRREKSGSVVKDKDKILPDLDEVISFFETNPGIWGEEQVNHVKHALKRLASRKSRLNSALHNPIEMIHRSETFQIRDDVLSFLRHMIEK